MIDGLFVYGTLAEGETMAGLLGRAPRRPATTRGTLWELPAGYPALVRSPQGTVHGELVELADARVLAILDLYEGVSEGLYEREVVDVVAGLTGHRAWAFVMPDARARGGRQVASGRWRRTRRR